MNIVVQAILLLGTFGASGPDGQLAFVTGTEQENQCVVVMDLKAGASVRVGPGSRDGAPRWSPDGQWLAFECQNNSDMMIRTVHPDGSGVRDFGTAHEGNQNPSWAPDSKRLAWIAEDGEELKQYLVTCDLETGTETRWGGEGASASILCPVWLPTTDLMKAMTPEQADSAEAAELVALKTEADTSGAITAVSLAGVPGKMSTEIMLVTPTKKVPMLPLLTKTSIRFAEWCVEPDHEGRQIAYESNDGGDREIFVIGKRGIANMSNHRAADWNPVWSPDNKRLAFESFRSGKRGVYIVLVGTGNVSAVDEGDEYQCWSPAWSADGEWIAYVSDKSGSPQIWAAPVEGGKSVQLTKEPGYAVAPEFKPKAKKQKESKS